ncbi:MAG: OmpH family outer membrane protein [Bacteroidia bacterium]
MFFMMLPFASQAQRFAYVDTEYILSQLPEYKSAQAQLDELSQAWQDEIDAMYEEIDKMYKEYQAEKVLLTKDMQTKRENEIIEKERAVKAFQNAKFGYDGELFKKRQELVKPIQDKVYEAINKVAKDNGLDFIFDKSGAMLMLVSNPKFDRSDEVLSELGVVPSDEPDTNNDLPPGSSQDTDNSNLPPR